MSRFAGQYRYVRLLCERTLCELEGTLMLIWTVPQESHSARPDNKMQYCFMIVHMIDYQNGLFIFY